LLAFAYEIGEKNAGAIAQIAGLFEALPARLKSATRYQLPVTKLNDGELND
jgi:hypothetical protein